MRRTALTTHSYQINPPTLRLSLQNPAARLSIESSIPLLSPSASLSVQQLSYNMNIMMYNISYKSTPWSSVSGLGKANYWGKLSGLSKLNSNIVRDKTPSTGHVVSGWAGRHAATLFLNFDRYLPR